MLSHSLRFSLTLLCIISSIMKALAGCARSDPVPISSFIHRQEKGEETSSDLYAIKNDFESMPQSSPAIFQDIEYFGGTVMTDTIRLYNIYYGDFNNTTKGKETIQLMNYFAANIGNSAWYKTLSSYFQLESNGHKTPASNTAQFKDSLLINPQKSTFAITETDIQEIIVGLIDSQDLPRDTNGVYTLIFNGTLQTPGWLTTSCSFHSSFFFPGTEDIIKYMVLNDPTTPPNNRGAICQAIHPNSNIPTANGNAGADSMVSFFAHELAEVITDSTGSWHFAPDENGQVKEISDACAWNFGTPLQTTTPNANIIVGDKPFLIQQIWRPAVGCTMG